jgi:hypothetical protein
MSIYELRRYIALNDDWEERGPVSLLEGPKRITKDAVYPTFISISNQRPLGYKARELRNVPVYSDHPFTNSK